jgi:hypothetical protein
MTTPLGSVAVGLLHKRTNGFGPGIDADREQVSLWFRNHEQPLMPSPEIHWYIAG